MIPKTYPAPKIQTQWTEARYQGRRVLVSPSYGRVLDAKRHPAETNWPADWAEFFTVSVDHLDRGVRR